MANQECQANSLDQINNGYTGNDNIGNKSRGNKVRINCLCLIPNFQNNWSMSTNLVYHFQVLFNYEILLKINSQRATLKILVVVHTVDNKVGQAWKVLSLDYNRSSIKFLDMHPLNR